MITGVTCDADPSVHTLAMFIRFGDSVLIQPLSLALATALTSLAVANINLLLHRKYDEENCGAMHAS